MKEKEFAVSMNPGGELTDEHLSDYTKAKYKPDSLFLWGPVPYVLMIACIIIDISFFKSLFSELSYDSPLLVVMEISGLAFACDVVPVFTGILSKRMKQGLSRDKQNLYLLLAVPILALIINGVLRVATMPSTAGDGPVDAVTAALTLIATAVPVFTSVGSYAISFLTYTPLETKMCKEELALEEAKDTCRRLEAIEAECADFDAERLKEMDRQHLINAKKELFNDALRLCAEVRLKLMEELADPASTNVLSKTQCDAIFARLSEELKALENISNSADVNHPGDSGHLDGADTDAVEDDPNIIFSKVA